MLNVGDEDNEAGNCIEERKLDMMKQTNQINKLNNKNARQIKHLF